ncbi:MAG: TetR/AcrR family transcriptional regulator [Chloroflexota bacterium]
MTATTKGLAVGRSSTPARSTRERILFVAAELFAQQGFHGTTTREIAAAVGVRQPSLFHHFPSKGTIAEGLLEWDLGLALPQVKEIAALPEPAAVRLYRYLLYDVGHLSSAPYNLSAIYNEEVIGSSDFARWARLRDELHDVVQGIVADGIASGEFIQIPAALVRQAIAGILVRALTLQSGGRGEGSLLADHVALLLVRGLLSDPSRIDEISRLAAQPPRLP